MPVPTSEPEAASISQPLAEFFFHLRLREPLSFLKSLFRLGDQLKQNQGVLNLLITFDVHYYSPRSSILRDNNRTPLLVDRFNEFG